MPRTKFYLDLKSCVVDFIELAVIAAEEGLDEAIAYELRLRLNLKG